MKIWIKVFGDRQIKSSPINAYEKLQELGVSADTHAGEYYGDKHGLTNGKKTKDSLLWDVGESRSTSCESMDLLFFCDW